MGALALSQGAAMDRIYRRQRHVYDLTRKYYLLGRDTLIADLAAGPGQHVLEVGCGTGRNLIVAARRYPGARFTGLDISAAMLATARAKVAAAGLSDRITLVEGDASAFDAAALSAGRGFDRVLFSYTLSMIPDWQRALAAGVKALAPGGRLALVDFGQQERLPALFRRALFAWLMRFDVTPRARLAHVAMGLAAIEGFEGRWSPLYRGYAWRAEILRPAAPAPRDGSFRQGL